MSTPNDQANPYEVTSVAGDASAATVVATKKFRWRVIPTTLSLIVGGLMLLGMPIALIEIFTFAWNGDDASKIILIRAIAIGSFFSVAGAANFIAGFCWMKGKWLYAVLGNAFAFGTTYLPAVFETLSL